MGESRAGDSLIFFAIIFFFISLLLTVFGLADDSISGTGGGDFNFSDKSTCTAPREYIDANGDIKSITEYSEKCSRTKAVTEEDCDKINGCEFTNETFLYFFTTSDVSCQGDINVTYYDANATDSALTFTNVCSLADVQDDPETCYLLGCTYVENARTLSDDTTFSEITSILGDLFTLRYDFATGNSIINAMLTFLLFYLPLIGIIISAYFSLPFLH